jgi:hypothetical protein
LIRNRFYQTRLANRLISGYISVMKKRVVDLTPDELDKLSGEAWSAAAQEALSKGLPVTGSRGGRRFRYYPNGHIEDLGPITPFPGELTETLPKKSSRKSVA